LNLRNLHLIFRSKAADLRLALCCLHVRASPTAFGGDMLYLLFALTLAPIVGYLGLLALLAYACGESA
jgi:hypothetical protein